MEQHLPPINLNLVHVGWTLGYGVGTLLFGYAARRSWHRLKDAEGILAIESVLHMGRLIFHLCLGLAILGFLHTTVGVLAVFRVPEINPDLLLVGAGIFGVLGYMEVSTVNAMLVAIKREAAEGVWERIKIPIPK